MAPPKCHHSAGVSNLLAKPVAGTWLWCLDVNTHEDDDNASNETDSSEEMDGHDDNEEGDDDKGDNKEGHDNNNKHNTSDNNKGNKSDDC